MPQNGLVDNNLISHTFSEKAYLILGVGVARDRGTIGSRLFPVKVLSIPNDEDPHLFKFDNLVYVRRILDGGKTLLHEVKTQFPIISGM